MEYRIRHLTRFRYTAPVYEGVTEVRMCPRDDGDQRLQSFTLLVEPKARIMRHIDNSGNVICEFTNPGHHQSMVITAQSIVSIQPAPAIPDTLPPDAWDALDSLVCNNDYWEMLLPSAFAAPTALLHEFAAEIDLRRRDDPLSVLRSLNRAIFERFEYRQQVTEVNSPIDEALSKRAGVCQDFAHIAIALVRGLGIPCRYVSGYLAPESGPERAASLGATHAWVEAFLPDLGWVGFDPTNNSVAASGHIRVAIGRDYADVPPTRGVYKGEASSELSVAVHINAFERTATTADTWTSPQWVLAAGTHVISNAELQQQQQQQ